jgi:hypothetical protein
MERMRAARVVDALETVAAIPAALVFLVGCALALSLLALPLWIGLLFSPLRRKGAADVVTRLRTRRSSAIEQGTGGESADPRRRAERWLN